MDARDAARELLRQLGAPTWAVSVAATLEEGRWSLVVRVDPGYGGSLAIPETFQGYTVSRQWRTPNIAFENKKHA